eukprot:scaffold138417_cov112-Phaeocystis_antarctica.AAC.1
MDDAPVQTRVLQLEYAPRAVRACKSSLTPLPQFASPRKYRLAPSHGGAGMSLWTWARVDREFRIRGSTRRSRHLRRVHEACR